MFSYRHAYHAGNHADVLKHMVLLAILDHMRLKPTPFSVIDTHAGAGWYRLSSPESLVSKEAGRGVQQLLHYIGNQTTRSASTLPQLLERYVQALQGFNALMLGNKLSHDAANPSNLLPYYPGSPALTLQWLRANDPIKLFELFGADKRLLERNMAELRLRLLAHPPYNHGTISPPLAQDKDTPRGASKGTLAGKAERSRPLAPIQTLCADGFEGLKRFIPPPSRRGLVLIDPSYEIKTDYRQVEQTLVDALKRFSTGTYMVWYPIVARPEAHTLARRLKTIASQSGKSWVQTSLSIKDCDTALTKGGFQSVADVKPSSRQESSRLSSMRKQKPDKLSASGVFVINPPYTLANQLSESLPILAQALGGERPATFNVWSS